MKILAIETSCDETAIAFVEVTMSQSNGGAETPYFEILENVVSSQIDVHRPFGGVVPSLAKREHLKNLPVVFEKLINIRTSDIPNSNINNRMSDVKKLDFDLIAVTVGPGLEPALWTGINFAKELAEKLEKPLVGVNHLEGHIYSNWLPRKPVGEALNPKSPFGLELMAERQTLNKSKILNPKFKKPKFPAIVLIVSGGHTILLRMDGIKQWEKLGETQDDAVGEAFDKVAKMLGLPYPGGPEVERTAQSIGVRPQYIEFPRPMLHSKDYNFSFSGLKTAVLYYLRDSISGYYTSSGTYDVQKLRPSDIKNICVSFQQAAIDVLVRKTMRAVKEHDARSVLLCGGVAANKALQTEFRFKIQDSGILFFVPELKYNTDNAVMIAAAAHLGNHYPTSKAMPNLNL